MRDEIVTSYFIPPPSALRPLRLARTLSNQHIQPHLCEPRREGAQTLRDRLFHGIEAVPDALDRGGQQGALQLLAFDVVHDLALLKPVDGAPLAGRGAVALRPWERGEKPPNVRTDNTSERVANVLAQSNLPAALNYVRPAFRRYGLGRQLAQALIDAATQAGYSAMLLDTLDDMEAARGLYESLGFEEIPPYYHNPLVGAHYLKAEL